MYRGFFRLWLLFSVLCVLALSSFFFGEVGREFFERIEAVSDAMRELMEDLWPELVHKLPPGTASELKIFLVAR
jgi:hypothetical protein